MEIDEDVWLWIVTTISMLVAFLVAEVVRVTLNSLLKSYTSATLFINYAISTFILIIGTYEKVILGVHKLKLFFYISTFLVCLIYAKLFHKYQPNPIAQFCNFWEQLKSDEKHGHSKNSLWVYSLAIPLCGQLAGLRVAIFWLDKVWGGWLTSAHMDNVSIVSECISCLNTGRITGFAIEAGLSLFYLTLAHYISNRTSKGQMFESEWVRDSVMSSAVIALLYIFIDITGAFANPLLAYSLERECLYDVTTYATHAFVYTIGPMFAAYMHLSYVKSSDKPHHH